MEPQFGSEVNNDGLIRASLVSVDARFLQVKGKERFGVMETRTLKFPFKGWEDKGMEILA